MKKLLVIIFIFSFYAGISQQTNKSTLSLLFMGDIMGHDSQIQSALQADSTYDYTECFSYVKPIISSVDIAIANLEVTLAGPPYKGYPQFSSPDALAIAARDAGVDVMGTANNHCVDRGKNGILRTIQVLDSLNISHTGTFRNVYEKEFRSPLIVQQNNIKLALINYTYGTNGIPVPSPVAVNLINLDSLSVDIEKAKALHPDKIILFIHWGIEYQHEPNQNQTELADFCFKKGVDVIIGSHPHVIQKSEWLSETVTKREEFITYSLGNFLSNQRQPWTDGGQMIKLIFEKEGNNTSITNAGYFLTWVYTPVIENKKHFYILPGDEFEKQPEFFESPDQFQLMETYVKNARAQLNNQNKSVHEYHYSDGNWEQTP